MNSLNWMYENFERVFMQDLERKEIQCEARTNGLACWWFLPADLTHSNSRPKTLYFISINILEPTLTYKWAAALQCHFIDLQLSYPWKCIRSVQTAFWYRLLAKPDRIVKREHLRKIRKVNRMSQYSRIIFGTILVNLHSPLSENRRVAVIEILRWQTPAYKTGNAIR